MAAVLTLRRAAAPQALAAAAAVLMALVRAASAQVSVSPGSAAWPLDGSRALGFNTNFLRTAPAVLGRRFPAARLG